MFIGGRPAAQGDPVWDDTDRAIAEAWFEYQDGLCSCGVPRDEGWATGNEFAWRGEVRHCFVCAAQDRARESFLSQESSKVTVEKHGMKVIAVPRE